MRSLAMAGAVVMLGMGMAACGGDAPAAGAAVRDSAGIRIVQNERPAWSRGQEWRVEAEPVVDVGVAEGDPSQQFARVSDALRLSDGTLLVADGQANEIRAFDARGRYLRTIGRAGGGPGEFRALDALHLLPGDTVAAYDYQGGRLSFFSFADSGRFVRGVSLGPVDGTMPLRPIGVFSDGRLLVAPLYNPVFNHNPKPTRDTITLALYGPSGTQTASLGRVPGEETVTIVAGGMAMRDPPPFGLTTSFAVQGARMLVGDAARYELVERRADGSVARLIRRAGGRERVTEADRQAYLRRRREGMNNARFRQISERMLASLTFPEHKPYFTGLEMDAGGNAWVQRPAAPDADVPWDVFDADGRFLGTVTVPAGLRVTQIGADFVVGVWKDELDVPHVRVHRIRKPAAR